LLSQKRDFKKYDHKNMILKIGKYDLDHFLTLVKSSGIDCGKIISQKLTQMSFIRFDMDFRAQKIPKF